MIKIINCFPPILKIFFSVLTVRMFFEDVVYYIIFLSYEKRNSGEIIFWSQQYLGLFRVCALFLSYLYHELRNWSYLPLHFGCEKLKSQFTPAISTKNYFICIFSKANSNEYFMPVSIVFLSLSLQIDVNLLKFIHSFKYLYLSMC